MTNFILGLHGFSAHNSRLLHDTGVSLVKNGRVIAAINEERFSRKKNDGLFPWHAYRQIFEMYQLTIQDIAAVAFPDKKPLWQTYNIFKYYWKTFRETGLLLNKYLYTSFIRGLDYKRIAPKELANKPAFFIEHHLCHAASAYYTAPWDDVVIVTLDGMGDWCIGGTINIGKNGKIKTLYKTNGFYSPGFFYMFITYLLGFKPGRHEGKIMGLAAYGNPNKCYAKLKDVIEYRANKHDFYSYVIPNELKNARYIDEDIKSDFNYFKEIISQYSPQDIAAATQKRMEEVVIAYVKDAVELTGKNKVILAGGVFANVKLNEKILQLPEINNIYIHPNMGDGGLSVGAALYVYHNKIKLKSKKFTANFMETVYLGPQYSDQEVESVLKQAGVNYFRCKNIALEIAQAIHNGKVVGLFHGRMEYGPRALGNRSILAAATDKNINKRLNERLNRTEFMPFAPAILEEYAQEFYPDWKAKHVAARFMTLTYRVANNHIDSAPAVVHVDNTARPQVIRQQDNPLFHQIITAYKEISGLPLVINTSFNLHEEPILCSPHDALRAFAMGAVDMLVINNFCANLADNEHIRNYK